MLRRILLASVGAIALTGSAAFAADLPSRAPPPMYLPPPVFTWSGIYIGLTAGFAQGYHSYTDEDFFNDAETGTSKTEGFIGGGTLGINWQQGNFVYGLETDFSGLTNSNTRFEQNPPGTTDDPLFFSNRINWLGTTRGRVGLAVDRTLIYFTAGVAYGGVHNSWGFSDALSTDPFVDIPPDGSAFSSGSTRVGWVVGGGLEYALTPNWSVKGEALYADLGSTTASFTSQFSNNTFRTRFDNTLVIIRAGVNYKFNMWGPGPVVAKY